MDGTEWRVATCGRVPVEPGHGPSIRRAADGRTHFAGLGVCGSIHTCPTCSAKIRGTRAGEIQEGLQRHLDDGGLALLVTLTAPHYRGQPLADLWPALAAAWRSILSGRSRRQLADLGLTGFVRCTETTYGEAHGWHVHVHLAVLFDDDLTGDQLLSLWGVLQRGWSAGLARFGIDVPASTTAVHLSTIASAEAVAHYVSKISGAAAELARSDLKRGRTSRTPFGILADLMATGAEGEWRLWREWCEASKGKRAIEWSRGLRTHLGVGEGPTDVEAAEASEPAQVICRLAPEVWQLVMRHDLSVRGATLAGAILEGAEVGGFEGVLVTLRRHGIRGRPALARDGVLVVTD